MTWQPIETAPKDGTAIQAEIPGNGADNVIAWHGGLADEAGMECSTWCFVTEQEPPDCWTDGWCWEVNEDRVASAKPTRWKPLPAQGTEAQRAETENTGSVHDGPVPEGNAP